MDDKITNRRFPLFVASVFAFMIVTAFVGSAVDPFAPVKIMLLKLFAVAGLLMWVHRSISAGEFSIRRTKADMPLLIYLLWTGAGVFYAPNKHLWRDQWEVLLCLAAIYFFTVQFFTTRAQSLRLVALMLVPMWFVAPMCVYDLLGKSYFPWDTLLINKYWSVFGLAGVEALPPATWLGNFDGRVSACFGNPVYMAGYLVFLIPIAWTVYRESESRMTRLFALGSAALGGGILIVTFTRSGWAACLAGLLVMAVLSAGKGRPARNAFSGFAALAVILLAISAIFLTKSRINPTIFSISERVASITDDKDGSRRERALIWQTAFSIARSKPLAGTGLNNYVVFHPLYQQSLFDDSANLAHISFPDRVHNEYLEAAAETGVPGMLMLLAVIAALASPLLPMLRTGGETARYGAAFAGGATALLLYAIGQFPFHIPAVTVTAMISAGLLPSLSGLPVPPKSIFLKDNPSIAEKYFFAALSVAIFIAVIPPFSERLLNEISFSTAIRRLESPRLMDHADRIPQFLEDARAPMSATPSNVEMRVRYGIAANGMAGKLSDRALAASIRESVIASSFEIAPAFPYESLLMINAGNAWLGLDNPELAARFLQTATALDPVDKISFYNLGIAYYKLGKYNSAKQAFLKALDSGREPSGVRMNLAMSYLQTGEYSNALTIFHELSGTPETSAFAFNGTGRCHSLMKQPFEAISDYRRALAINPGMTDARGNLAIELINTGSFPEAIKELRALLDENPGDPAARYHLGRALAAEGRYGQAYRELAAAATDPLIGAEARKLMNSISGRRINR